MVPLSASGKFALFVVYRDSFGVALFLAHLAHKHRLNMMVVLGTRAKDSLLK